VPWCEECSKFWNPHEMPSNGTCPTCGRALPPPAAAPEKAVGRSKRAPWHFKLLVVGVAGYMVYRVIWFIEWLPKHV
jgi:hypothetical protein